MYGNPMMNPYMTGMPGMGMGMPGMPGMGMPGMGMNNFPNQFATNSMGFGGP